MMLPPGYYVHSPGFPAMMNNLCPAYWVQVEPVFLDHLHMNLGKRLEVATVIGPLTGTLTGIAVDHLQLTVNQTNYHIRYAHIVYFKE